MSRPRKCPAALANPANYFELTFNALAGIGYHFWLRGKADKDSWANNSVFVQFSASVNAAGTAVNRIGTTGAATVSIEEGANAGVAGWGWADENYGALGGKMYFKTAGPQTIRIQVREDGMSIDQIVLSADRYATRAPGKTKNDTTILTSGSTQPTLSIDVPQLGHATYGTPSPRRCRRAEHRLDDLVGGVGTAAGRHGAERRRRPERHADRDRRLHLHRAGAGCRLAGEHSHRADRAHGRGAGLYRCRAGAVAGRGRPAV